MNKTCSVPRLGLIMFYNLLLALYLCTSQAIPLSVSKTVASLRQSRLLWQGLILFWLCSDNINAFILPTRLHQSCACPPKCHSASHKLPGASIAVISTWASVNVACTSRRALIKVIDKAHCGAWQVCILYCVRKTLLLGALEIMWLHMSGLISDHTPFHCWLSELCHQKPVGYPCRNVYWSCWSADPTGSERGLGFRMLKHTIAVALKCSYFLCVMWVPVGRCYGNTFADLTGYSVDYSLLQDCTRNQAN